MSEAVLLAYYLLLYCYLHPVFGLLCLRPVFVVSPGLCRHESTRTAAALQGLVSAPAQPNQVQSLRILQFEDIVLKNKQSFSHE